MFLIDALEEEIKPVVSHKGELNFEKQNKVVSFYVFGV